MADIRYFNGTNRLKGMFNMPNNEFKARYPGVKGMRYDGYSMWVGYLAIGEGGPLPVERKIEFKAFPSKHECNAKCLGGKATGKCECQCGGANHGRGMFTELVKLAA